ncbi:MAG TPA: 23S rRNA (uracil(1939)-C(5))-methyltransferase RlmD [Gammaproteobacteria bacterium]|nr:23S rRNA (uracil(1939)-C(5))-methyltransferase RlmD [Gammaproteobacteria bacterium]
MAKRKNRAELPVSQGRVSNLSHDGRGVVHLEDKVVFVDGALPEELIRFQITGKRRKVYQGQLREVLESSLYRVAPECRVFGTCGGCALQHQSITAQQAFKQDVLVQSLQRLAKLTPQVLLPVLHDHAWHYRRKARLGVRLVPKKGGILVGFRERGKSYITNLNCCPVLDERLSALLLPLQKLLSSLSIKEAIPQIEVAAAAATVALVFRHLQAFTTEDRQLLKDFARTEAVQVLLQPGGPDSVQALWPPSPQTLSYRLDDFDLELIFTALDFIQVNAKMNQKLVQHAINLLAIKRGQTVLDLFCGLGNFSLAAARRGGQVTGIEGDAGMVSRAHENACHNRLDGVTAFHQADLFESPLKTAIWLDQHYDDVLLDPPRSGAFELVSQMQRWRPGKIVYVSCNPATLARDAAILVHQQGYHLRATGIADLFPHTTHVEAVALFEL